MQISVKLRKHEIDPKIVAARLSDEDLVLFDNCTEVSWGKSPVVTDKAGFKQVSKISDFPGLTKHVILKDPAFIDKEKELVWHYRTIHWVDRITHQRHELVYDTFAFIMNDKGVLQTKLKG